MGRTPQVSLLVAHRGDEWRDRLWRFIRERFEAQMPDVEIVVGTDDGIDPFHKTLAYNRAAHEATGDVFVISDTDTWVDPDAIRTAAANVGEAWYRPYRLKVKLLEQDTLAALAEGPSWRFEYRPKGAYERRTAFWGGPPFVVSREMYEAVHGFDERFRGWGAEDEAFARSLRSIYGPARVIDTPAVHLWHPRIGASGRDLWPGQTTADGNRRLLGDYVKARHRDAMQHLIETR